MYLICYAINRANTNHLSPVFLCVNYYCVANLNKKMTNKSLIITLDFLNIASTNEAPNQEYGTFKED